MKQPDNHIDELLEKHRHDYWDYCKNLIDSTEFEKREDEAKQELDEHYKKKYLALVPEKRKGLPSYDGWSMSAIDGYNKAIDEMTAWTL